MSWVATAIAGSAVIGAASSYLSSKSQKKAAEAGGDATVEAQLIAVEAQEKALERVIELNEPFRLAGVEALPALIEETERGAPTFDEFVASPEAAAIREAELEDITKATERSAAARGNLFSPSTQLELQNEALKKTRASKLGQYDASLIRRGTEINELTNLVNIGRGATTSQSGAIQETGANVSNIVAGAGQNLSNLELRKGDATASGYANIGNIASNTAGNLILANALKI